MIIKMLIGDGAQNGFVRNLPFFRKHLMRLILCDEHTVVGSVQIEFIASELEISENNEERKRDSGQGRDHLASQTEKYLPPGSVLGFPIEIRLQLLIEIWRRLNGSDALSYPSRETQEPILPGARFACRQMRIEISALVPRQLIVDPAEEQFSHCMAFHLDSLTSLL
jgi:hypothetical protein